MPAAPTTHGGPAARAARRPARPRRSLLHGLIAVIVLWVALATAGGTYAFWTAEATVDAGTVSTGSAALEARWTAPEEARQLRNLLPGETATRSLTIANTGDVALALSAARSRPARGHDLTLSEGHCGNGAAVTSPLHDAAQTIPSAVGSGPDAIARPGTEIELCLHVTATTDLTPGTETALSVRIGGTQTA